MLLCLIFLLGNYLNRYTLVISFQSLKTWFLKEQDQQRIQICNNFHLFFIVMETSSHILWHAINKHEKQIIIMNFFIKKGPRILSGQFLFLDCPLRVFLVGPPNHTFTPLQ